MTINHPVNFGAHAMRHMYGCQVGLASGVQPTSLPNNNHFTNLARHLGIRVVGYL